MLPERGPRRYSIGRPNAARSSKGVTPEPRRALRSFRLLTAWRWLDLVALRPCSAILLNPYQLIQPTRPTGHFWTSTVYDTGNGGFLEDFWRKPEKGGQRKRKTKRKRKT